MSEQDGQRQGTWGEILLIYVIGVLGATTISQAIPVIGDIARTFHPQHEQGGWIISAPSALVAIGALFVGWVVDRIGDKVVLLAGIALVVAGDCGVAMAASFPTLLGMRILEGVGYVCIAVAAITMMTRITHGPRRNIALTLWSSFIPMSFALPMILAAKLAGTGQWRWAFTGHAIALALLGVVALGLLPERGRGSEVKRSAGLVSVLRSPGPYLLGLAFAFAAFMQTGIVAILPRLLPAKFAVSVASAAAVVTLGMALNTAGCLIVGPLLNRGVKALPITLLGVALAVLGGVALGEVASTFAIAAVSSGVFFFGAGVVVGLWALLPRVAPNMQSLGATSGLVTQVTLWGVLFGPPAAFAAQGDWVTVSRNIVIAAAAIVLLIWCVTSRFSRAGASQVPGGSVATH